MTETEARQVVGVQSHEAGAESALWSAEDRAWATRLALQTSGAAASFERFVVERARHALERLAPRDPALRRWLARRLWRPAWIGWVALAAWIVGAAVDHVGAPQRIDLLAPPVWAVVAWNLAVYLALALPRHGAVLRRWVARRWLRALPGAAALWVPPATPLALARAAVLLHVAAAALAFGLASGLYLRGLVLDYRAGWQSTFLEPGFVQALLSVLLAPARALTGIALPEVAPLRIAAGQAASGAAAPWIHLYAATLALFVVVPRLVLAAVAAWRARRLAVRFPLPLEGAYFERLRRQQHGGKAKVQVLPHGADPGAQAALGLRALLAGALGDDLELRVAPATRHGDEPPAAGDATLRVVLVDLAATPEPEEHGRFVSAAAQGAPPLLVADESAFKRRFAGLPERVAERRAAWLRLADELGVPFVAADLAEPDLAAAARALKVALA